MAANPILDQLLAAYAQPAQRGQLDPVWQQLINAASPPGAAPPPGGAGMSYAPPIPGRGENISQFDLMMASANQPPPSMGPRQMESGYGAGPFASPPQASPSMPPMAPQSSGMSFNGFQIPAPNSPAGFGDEMDLRQGGAGNSAEPGRDYLTELQELANGTSKRDKGKDRAEAIAGALREFGIHAIGKNPRTILGQIGVAAGHGGNMWQKIDDVNEQRDRADANTQYDNLLKQYQVSETSRRGDESLALREQLGLMNVQRGNDANEIKSLLGQAGIAQREKEMEWKRNIAGENLKIKQGMLDNRTKTDAETLRIRAAEAQAKNSPFDRRASIDELKMKMYSSLGLDNPSNFYGEDFAATKSLWDKYAASLEADWAPQVSPSPSPNSPTAGASTPAQPGMATPSKTAWFGGKKYEQVNGQWLPVL